MGDADGRYVVHTEQFGGSHAAVTGDYPVAPIDENGADKPKLLNAGSDLFDLFCGVGPGISRTRLKVRRVFISDLKTSHRAPQKPSEATLFSRPFLPAIFCRFLVI